MEYKGNKRICFLDIETTDKFWNSSAPIQIAAAICDNQGNIIDCFNERIKTNRVITPSATAVHGIRNEDLVNCPKEGVVLRELLTWLTLNQVDAICTYNGESFDRPLLNCRYQLFKIPCIYFDKDKFQGIDGYKDCVKIAKQADIYGLKTKLGKKWNLSAVANVLGIDNRAAHDALADVIMLKDVWFKLDPIVHPEDWGGCSTSSLF